MTVELVVVTLLVVLSITCVVALLLSTRITSGVMRTMTELRAELRDITVMVENAIRIQKDILEKKSDDQAKPSPFQLNNGLYSYRATQKNGEEKYSRQSDER